MMLVLWLIMNDGLSFDSANRTFRIVPGCMGKCRIDRWWSPSELESTFAQVPEQSELTYGVYLVAAGHLWRLGEGLSE